MSHVLFIRHAETGMAGRFCGHSDPDLNAAGRTQLVSLAAQLSAEPIDAVYSSDLRRASSTAQAIAAAKNLTKVLRPALREIDFGQWEGLTWQEIEQKDHEYAREWMARFPNMPAPSGEAFSAFEARVLEELHYLFAATQRPIAVVTHAGVLRLVLQHLCGRSARDAWEEARSYCCVVRYQPPVNQGECI